MHRDLGAIIWAFVLGLVIVSWCSFAFVTRRRTILIAWFAACLSGVDISIDVFIREVRGNQRPLP